MERIQWTESKRTLGELLPWSDNPRQIRGKQAERLLESVEEFGQVETLAIGPANELYNGHQRLKVLMQKHGPRYVVDVCVASRGLSERERQKLTVYLHKGAAGEWDFETLANVFDTDDLLAWGFEAAELGLGADDAGDSDAGAEPIESAEDSPLTRRDVPDALWPSDNDWGIPLLDISMQATAFDQPAAIWGSTSRKARMNGTWLFYTEDYRYEALWLDPSPVLNTGAIGATEPNFSCYSNMPGAVALWQIYRKRWIARWWQQNGLRVWADLNVAENHAELNRMGIPQGWRAFATRGYTARLDGTHAEYEIACEIAGDKTPLFLVYGGGKAVKAEAQRMGWLWVVEDMDAAKGREIADA